jgi:hypothetical protein
MAFISHCCRDVTVDTTKQIVVGFNVTQACLVESKLEERLHLEDAGFVRTFI